MSALEPPASPTSAYPTRGGKRHQLKRSISELASPTKPHRHLHSRHGPQYDDKNQLSAATKGRHSLEMPHSVGVTPNMSPNQSRRGSFSVLQLEGGPPQSFKDARNDNLSLEQNKVTESAANLTRLLSELNSFSTSASQRLDEAYYTVLEKMSTLQNTVRGLKELIDSSNELYDTFETNSRGLENEIATQLGALGHFQGQKNRISSLQGRITNGKKEVRELCQRVENVLRRVETWEKADKQWQEKTRKRLKIIWSVMSVIVLSLIVLVWAVNSSTNLTSHKQGITPKLRGPSLSILEPLNRSNNALPPGDDVAAIRSELHWEAPDAEDPRLRVFDEI